MNDLELDVLTGDIRVDEGDLFLLNNEAKVARQTLEINFRFYQGEWFLDNTYGVPYLQVILMKGTPKSVVDTIIRDVTLDSYNITNIIKFSSSINSVTRAYIIDELIAETIDGDIVSITNIQI